MESVSSLAMNTAEQPFIRIGENWKCPYCGHAQVIIDDRYSIDDIKVYKRGWKVGGYPMLFTQFVICSNNDCQELTLTAFFGTSTYKNNQLEYERTIQQWSLLPASRAKPQPDYIPEALRTDYLEACAIRDLSPKASATIIRRCLQGMIRHFCGISKRRLIDEIDELRKRVEEGRSPPGVQADTVDAIDRKHWRAHGG